MIDIKQRRRMSNMQFVTVRDFRTSSKEIWGRLSNEEEIVVTNNGKPTALLLNIPDGDFEETLQDVRRAKLLRTLEDAREEAADRGFLTDDEIGAEIQAARAEMKASGRPQ
jgi:antitoxin (DNA-binding transcriptional repressor) of toxin-antitoxin stability system